PGGGCPTDAANPICGNNGTCDCGGKCTVAAAGASCGYVCQGDSKVAKSCAAGKVCTGGMCKNCNPANNDGCAAGKVCVNDTCKTPAGGSYTASGECA